MHPLHVRVICSTALLTPENISVETGESNEEWDRKWAENRIFLKIYLFIAFYTSLQTDSFLQRCPILFYIAIIYPLHVWFV